MSRRLQRTHGHPSTPHGAAQLHCTITNDDEGDVNYNCHFRYGGQFGPDCPVIIPDTLKIFAWKLTGELMAPIDIEIVESSSMILTFPEVYDHDAGLYMPPGQIRTWAGGYAFFEKMQTLMH